MSENVDVQNPIEDKAITLKVGAGDVMLVTESAAVHNIDGTMSFVLKGHIAGVALFKDDGSGDPDQYSNAVKKAKEYPCYYVPLHVDLETLELQDTLTNMNSGFIVNNGLVVFGGDATDTLAYSDDNISVEYEVRTSGGKETLAVTHKIDGEPMSCLVVVHTDNEEALRLAPAMTSSLSE